MRIVVASIVLFLLAASAFAADVPDQTAVLRAYIKHLQEDRAALQTQVDALRVQMDQDKDAAAADKAAAVKAVDDWWRGNPSDQPNQVLGDGGGSDSQPSFRQLSPQDMPK